MNTNESDNVVRNKLGTLTPLEGGIVYGREEAWDKLQARMDKKPAKRVMIYYTLAAAAVVLLLAGVLVLLKPHETSMVKKIRVKPAAPEQKITEAPAPLTTHVFAPSYEAQKQKVAIIHKKVQNRTADGVKQDIVPAPAPAELPVANEIKTVQNTIVPNKAEPVKPSVKDMRVVHINELDEWGQGYNNNTLQTDNKAHVVAIGKMKVMTMSDITGEERSIAEPEKENKAQNTTLSFIKPLYNRSSSDYGAGLSLANNPLKIKIHLQN